MDYNETFRATVTERMAKMGWSMVKLAKRAGIPYTSVATLLGSKHRPGSGRFYFDTAMAIDDALKGKRNMDRVNPEDDAA
jgi:hypothetical protein